MSMNRRFKTGSVRARLSSFGVHVGVGVGLLAVPALASPARADKVEDAARRLADLERRVGTLSAEFKEAPSADSANPDQRYVEAQKYYELKNYDVAATLCLDIIDRYPNSRVYDDAIVLLGESLFKDGDILSSRRYFEQAIKKRTGSRQEQQALQRLIEIALRTQDFDHVEDHLSRLGQIPPAQLEPSVPYVRGKYLFFRDKTDEALVALAQVGPQNPYYLQARYLAATVNVKKGDLASALTIFDEVLRVQGRNDADKEVQDLARLAIARILFDRGQFDKAKEAYASIPRQSKYFQDAMYESAWNSIKAKDYKSAYRALDLMLLQNPDSPQAPELRLLMGNLNLRMANFFVASETFGKTRDEFEPIYKQLEAAHTQAKNDPKYFDQLIGKGLDKFDISLFLPVGAVKYARAEPDVERMLVLAEDVGELQRGIKESEQMLQNLERAVYGAGKVGIFADLGAARLKSTEVLNQTIDIRRRFINDVRALAGNYLSGEDKAALEAVEADRLRLDSQLTELPLTENDMRKREGQAQGQLAALDRQASEFNVIIQGLEAELVAIESYYIHSRADQKIRAEDLKAPVADLRGELDRLRAGLEKVRTEIVDATREASVGGSAAANERLLALRLGEAMKRQNELLLKARDRMTGSARSEFDAYTSILSRADAVQSRLAGFDDKLEAIAEKRLVSIRETLSAEKAQLQEAAARLGTVLTESQGVGGGLAQEVLAKVTDRFYDLTVQSDVGLIDVSWGLKDSKTSNVSKLINQQKMELKSVEDDFRSLLEEDR
jgi:TolA-binding protein